MRSQRLQCGGGSYLGIWGGGGGGSSWDETPCLVTEEGDTSRGCGLREAEWLWKPGPRAAGWPGRWVCLNLGLCLRTSEKNPAFLQNSWLRGSGDLAGSGGWEVVRVEERRDQGNVASWGGLSWARLGVARRHRARAWSTQPGIQCRRPTGPVGPHGPAEPSLNLRQRRLWQILPADLHSLVPASCSAGLTQGPAS